MAQRQRPLRRSRQSKADHPPDQHRPASAEAAEQVSTWRGFWGDQIWQKGFVLIPNRLLTQAKTIGLDAVGLALVAHLLSFARPGSSPWPAMKTLAARLGLGERHLRRRLASLEEAGLLQRQARLGRSSAFDFGGLVQQLEAQVNATPAISSRGDTDVTPGRQRPPRTSASALDASGRPPRTCMSAHPGHQRPPKQKTVKQMTGEADDNSRAAAAIAALVKAGVARKTAARLVSECGPEVVEQQLEWIGSRNADDPVRMLVAAIKGNYPPPRMTGRSTPAPPEAFGEGGATKFSGPRGLVPPQQSPGRRAGCRGPYQIGRVGHHITDAELATMSDESQYASKKAVRARFLSRFAQRTAGGTGPADASRTVH